MAIVGKLARSGEAGSGAIAADFTAAFIPDCVLFYSGSADCIYPNVPAVRELDLICTNFRADLGKRRGLNRERCC